MASYHFTIKLDRRPDGSSVSAKDHAEYINRDGRFKDIDEKGIQEIDQFEWNTISAPENTKIPSNNQVPAAAHAQYINREAAFEKRGGCVHKDHYLPKWANNSPKEFFAAAHQYESPKGTVYREIEFALPNELNLDQQKEIVEEFVAKHLGEDFYWALAIHDKEATMGNGERNPHVHIMFSERKLDDIEKNQERPAKYFFKKANRVNREKGGPNKDQKWNGKDRTKNLIEMRKDCAMIQNKILEKYGFDVTVDHRSLVAQKEAALAKGDKVLAQILDRMPEQNIGPRIASQADHEKVIELKRFRQVKREHQQLITAADVLEKMIVQKNTNQSVQNSIEQANFALSEIQNKDLQNLRQFSEKIIATSKELSVMKDLMIWNDKALPLARRSFMKPEELEIENRSRTISEEKLNLKRLQKQLELGKPEEWTKESLAEYTWSKKEINRRLTLLEQESKKNAAKLQSINSRFSTKDYRIKINKKVKEILEENQEVKNQAEILQNRLNNLTYEVRTIIHQTVLKQTKNFYQETNFTLPGLNQEKENLVHQQTELQKQKTEFTSKERPPFYDVTYPAWSEESFQFKTKEAELDEKLKIISEKIDTLQKEEAKIKTTLQKKQTNSIVNPPQEETQTNPPFIQLTAKEIQTIINAELRSLKTEFQGIESELKRLDVYSYSRVEAMAKDKYLKGALKDLRDEQGNIEKEQYRIEKAIEEKDKAVSELNAMDKPSKLSSLWNKQSQEYYALEKKIKLMEQDIAERQAALNDHIKANQQKSNDIEKQISTPEAKYQIQKITNAILKQNEPIAKRHNELVSRQSRLVKNIAETQSMKTAVNKRVNFEISESKRNKAAERKYNVSASTGENGGSNSFSRTDAAKAFANLLMPEPKIGTLIVKLDDNEKVDTSMMTQEQLETFMAQQKAEHSL